MPGSAAAAAYPLSSAADVLTWIDGLAAALFSPTTVCGDGLCHSPFEHPAFGALGCAADCGSADTSPIILRVASLFGARSGDPFADAGAVSFNLCWTDSPLAAAQLGYPDVCWWAEDQARCGVSGGVSSSPKCRPRRNQPGQNRQREQQR